jgi:hypothetical protein
MRPDQALLGRLIAAPVGGDKQAPPKPKPRRDVDENARRHGRGPIGLRGEFKEPRPMIRWKRLAPYFLAGPISGPLLAGAVLNFNAGRPVLGGLYAVALAQYTVLLPVAAAHMTHMAMTLS